MRESEILRTIKDRRDESHCFIRWWRKENDFLDYDLIERFTNNATGNNEIGGFDLLTMEDMWGELQRVSTTPVKLVHDASGDKVEWVHKGKSGVTTQVCLYTPETLMTIFDVETKGNPVD